MSAKKMQSTQRLMMNSESTSPEACTKATSTKVTTAVNSNAICTQSKGVAAGNERCVPSGERLGARRRFRDVMACEGDVNGMRAAA